MDNPVYHSKVEMFSKFSACGGKQPLSPTQEQNMTTPSTLYMQNLYFSGAVLNRL